MKYKRKYRRILQGNLIRNEILEIKGGITKMIFFRNCPPGNMLAILDSLGFVYIYRATEEEFKLVDMLRQKESKFPLELFIIDLISDMIAVKGSLVLSTSDGDIIIFKINED